MKRKLSTLLKILTVTTACIVLTSAAAYAAATPQLTISQAQAQPGERVQLHIRMDGNPGITSLDFSVQYDPSQLELVGKQNGTLLGGVINSQTLDKVPYYCGWINSLQRENCTDDGTLMTLTFQVKEGAVNGKQAVSFTKTEVTAYDADIQAVKFQTSGGYIEVKNGKEPQQPVTPAGGNTGGSKTETPQDPAAPSESSETEDPASDSKTELTAAQKKIIAKVEGMKITYKSAEYDKTKRKVFLKYQKSNKNYKLDGYQIYRSSKKTTGFKRTGTTTKTSWTDKRPGSKGASCYYKIRGFRKVAGKTYYTAWSVKKKIVIK